MKSKLITLLFTLGVVGGYSQIQLPNIGIGPDTGTGDNLRTAMEKLIANDAYLDTMGVQRLDSLISTVPDYDNSVNIDSVLKGDAENLIIAAAVLRPNGVSTGSALITWTLLNSSQHIPLYFTGVSTNASGQIVLTFPEVANVVSFIIVPDELMSKNGVFCGASVGTTTATINVYQTYGVYGGYLIGSGTSWTKAGGAASFTFGTLDSDQIYFRPPKPFGNTGTDAQNTQYWNSALASYVGSNDRRLKKITSGLGSDYFGYQLLDNAGNPVVTNDANDIVEIITTTPKVNQLNAHQNDSFGYPGANIFTTSANFWVFAVFQKL